VNDDADRVSGTVHTSVPPVVVSLAVDPSTMAAISETLSTDRPRPWLGPIIVVITVGVLIVVAIVGSAQVGVTPGVGTPVPSF
jgi:hypothetical protein